MFNNNHHITEESFGSLLPENWQEIAGRLNARIDELLAGMPDAEQDEIHDEVNKIWDEYCSGQDLESEIKSFVGCMFIAEGDPQPMTEADAAINMAEWIKDDVEYPFGMTPAMLAAAWNREIDANRNA